MKPSIALALIASLLASPVARASCLQKYEKEVYRLESHLVSRGEINRGRIEELRSRYASGTFGGILTGASLCMVGTGVGAALPGFGLIVALLTCGTAYAVGLGYDAATAAEAAKKNQALSAEIAQIERNLPTDLASQLMERQGLYDILTEAEEGYGPALQSVVDAYNSRGLVANPLKVESLAKVIRDAGNAELFCRGSQLPNSLIVGKLLAQAIAQEAR
jgi:hypothetical protein